MLFGIDALFTVLSGVVMTVFLREPPRVPPHAGACACPAHTSLGAVTRSRFASRLFLALFILQLGTQLCFPYVPLLIQALSTGPTQQAAVATTIGWVLTVSGLAGAVATPLWGRLGDTLGHVRVLIVAVVLVALTLLAQYAAPSLIAFAAARTAYGAVQVALTALGFAALAMNVPEEQRASILNLGMLPFYVAAVLAPSAATLLLPLGVAALFLVSSAITLLALPMLITIAQPTGEYLGQGRACPSRTMQWWFGHSLLIHGLWSTGRRAVRTGRSKPFNACPTNHVSQGIGAASRLSGLLHWRSDWRRTARGAGGQFR